MTNSSPPPNSKKQIGGSSDYDPNFSISGVKSVSSPTNSSSHQVPVEEPLKNMSSLPLRKLPMKRGLSIHYDGKSQSFTSLSDVKCLEDLPKPDNPYKKKKKFKSCWSHGGLLMLSSKKTISPPPTFF